MTAELVPTDNMAAVEALDPAARASWWREDDA